MNNSQVLPSSLDKLAQLRSLPETPYKQRAAPDPRIAIQKRARSKLITQSIILAIINSNPDSKLIKSYWNTYHCSNRIYYDGTKKTVKYCKNRFCMTCSRVKTARMINKYLPIIETYENPVFVTLTIPNVKGEHLRATIDSMQKCFYSIINLRSNRKIMRGIRKLECTYNPIRYDFHPHFHVLIDGMDNALRLQQLWLDKNPTAVQDAQDIEVADTNSMKELFKYLTKINISLKKDDRRLYPKALDTIFQAFHNKRTISGFGNPKTKDVAENYETLNDEFVLRRRALWEWEREYFDWIDYETGELLSGYIPDSNALEIIDRINNPYKYERYKKDVGEIAPNKKKVIVKYRS